MSFPVGVLLCAGFTIQCSLLAYRRRLLSIQSMEQLKVEQSSLELQVNQLKQQWRDIPSQLKVDKKGMVEVKHLQDVLEKNIYNPEDVESTGLAIRTSM